MTNHLPNDNKRVTLNDISQNVIQVHEQHGWRRRTPEERMLYLISEVGELATTLIEVDKLRENLADDLRSKISGEMVDVLWNICDLAIGLGLDLNYAATQKLEEMSVRTWNDPK